MLSKLALLAIELAPTPHYAIHYYILKDCSIIYVGEEKDDRRRGKEERKKGKRRIRGNVQKKKEGNVRDVAG